MLLLRFPLVVVAFFGAFILGGSLVIGMLHKLILLWRESRERKLRELMKELDIEFQCVKSEHGIFKKGVISGVIAGFLTTLLVMLITVYLKPAPFVVVPLWGANFILVFGLFFGFFDKMFVCPMCGKRALVKVGLPPFSPTIKYASRKYVYTFVCRNCKFTAIEEFTVTRV
jgi:transcription elongation factor Elf1